VKELLLTVHRVKDVRQVEIHTTELLVPFADETAIAKLKRCKSPDTDEILAELIQEGDESLLCQIHKIINSVLNKKELLRSGRVHNFSSLP
jgi:hypothetical protein